MEATSRENAPPAQRDGTGRIGGRNPAPFEQFPLAGEGVDLPEVDFKHCLPLAESLLVTARQLADCVEDGPLDDLGERLLFGVAMRWLDLERALFDVGLLGDGDVFIPCEWHERDDPRLSAFKSLRELAEVVRGRSDWRRRLPDRPSRDATPLGSDPPSTMGVSHSLFAKRLVFVVEQLKEAIAMSFTKRAKLSKAEANEIAILLAKANPHFIHGTVRQWASDIGCSPSQVVNLPLWKGKMERTKRGPKPRASPRNVVSFTPTLEATTGRGDDRSDELLASLVADQNTDYEPSPLEDDPPGARPRKVRQRKRL